ncbi:MAG: anhydro-N-acetylmuramic acid kinase [Bacteroidales bacterium]|nr:anhydro-N-acetylmuramic acid kinase [Bacteroidales bacterium]
MTINPKTVYHVLGLMSGTSLDGLDIAYCRFERIGDRWTNKILQAETIPYSIEWQTRLRNLDNGTAADLAKTDIDLGHLMGATTKDFIQRHQVTADFIASHGQTIFHQPHLRWTTQIGKGSSIAAETGLPVICDFRSTDVAFGGQGAPLVPIGDRLLFSDYHYCLNLGGFANISYEREGKRMAYDICPTNMVLNTLTGQLGKAFDENGDLARSGSLLPDLLETLNQLPFYHQPPPKSLGKEWVDAHILPLIMDTGYGIRDTGYGMRDMGYGIRDAGYGIRDAGSEIADLESRIADLLHTFTEHIAMQIGKNTGTNRVNKLLITGGGALNNFLMERIRHHTAPQVILPDLQTIHFKEALIFAFLGLLRWRGEVNCLSSVTGASRDNIGGAIYLG